MRRWTLATRSRRRQHPPQGRLPLTRYMGSARPCTLRTRSRRFASFIEWLGLGNDGRCRRADGRVAGVESARNAQAAARGVWLGSGVDARAVPLLHRSFQRVVVVFLSPVQHFLPATELAVREPPLRRCPIPGLRSHAGKGGARSSNLRQWYRAPRVLDHRLEACAGYAELRSSSA
jgi:hypothetical protein